MTHHRFVSSLLIGGLAFASATGCTDIVAPVPLPEGAYPVVPDAFVRDWWHEMEMCAERTGDFDDVHWYVVPGDQPFAVRGVDHLVTGYWDPHGNRIVLLESIPMGAGRIPGIQLASLVRHESLHAILQRTDHPPEFFETRCGAAIAGEDGTAPASDLGRWPAPLHAG